MSCREISCLSQPLVYVGYMEMEVEVWGPKAVKLVVDNRGVQDDVKVELALSDIYSEGIMVS